MWFIARTKEDDETFEIIPDLWLSTNKKFVKWPKYTPQKTLKAIREKKSPEDDWQYLKVAEIIDSASNFFFYIKQKITKRLLLKTFAEILLYIKGTIEIAEKKLDKFIEAVMKESEADSNGIDKISDSLGRT